MPTSWYRPNPKSSPPRKVKPASAVVENGDTSKLPMLRHPGRLPMFTVLYPQTKGKTYEEVVVRFHHGEPMLVGRRVGALTYVTIGDVPPGSRVILAYSSDHKQRCYTVV